ncbi:MAG: hypothetical protein ACWA5L_09520 [bacterium]
MALGSLKKISSLIIVFAALLFMCACETSKKVPKVAVDMDQEEMSQAAQSPLYDLNLKREEIPAELLILDNLYSEPRQGKCSAAQYEVASLTRVLGPDPADSYVVGRDGRTYTLKPADALSSTLSGLIPYGDIVRYVTGASGHEKKRAEAFYKGQIRRAFLKGWMQNNGCEIIPIPRVKPVREE